VRPVHLDTSFLIRALVGGSPEDGLLRGWIAERRSVGISAVAWAEFLCGPWDQGAAVLVTRIAGEAIGFTAAHAQRAAALFNASGRRRGTLADCMIAAVAIVEGAALATANQGDFGGFTPHGLALSGPVLTS
jgi:predicted nucleic acid-binding protein